MILMGWVHYCPMTCRCVWCRPASPVSAWEPGGRSASPDPDAGQPDPASRRAGQLSRLSPGVTLCTHCHASEGRLQKIYSLWNIFYTLLHWHCDFMDFSVKISGLWHYRKMFPSENRWDGNDGAPLSVSVMGFIRISQHIAHELEISVYYLQFTLFRLSLHLSVAVCVQSQQH